MQPVNLNKVRKARAKATARADAAANRAGFGRTKSEKAAEKLDRAKAQSVLDGARRTPRDEGGDAEG